MTNASNFSILSFLWPKKPWLTLTSLVALTFLAVVVVYVRLSTSEFRVILSEADIRTFFWDHQMEQSKLRRINKRQLCLWPMKNVIKSCILDQLIGGKMTDSSSLSAAATADISKVYANLPSAVKYCSAILRHNLAIVELTNKDDTKYVVFSANDSSVDQSCNVATLGIGNDTVAEEKLRNFKPHCKFVGADPIRQSGQSYESLGVYIQKAVTAHGGANRASVLRNNHYVPENLSSISIDEFFNQSGFSHIDYLFLDAEGAEYALLDYWGSSIKRDPWNHTGAICQISLEIHGLEPQITAIDFGNIMLNLIRNGPYLPVIGYHYGTLIRMFWIDFQTDFCLQKYYPNFCSQIGDSIYVQSKVRSKSL